MSSYLKYLQQSSDDNSASFITLPIDQIKPGQFQPRTHFSQEQLQSLAESITQKGILQPILVRPLPEGGYEIVAGERRYRAAQMANLTTIPVVVKDLSDREALEIGLIENLHRQNLNPIDEAECYKHLMEKFNYTQESLAKAITKSQAHISNMLRLLDLPYVVQFMVYEGKLPYTHARFLVGVQNATKIAKKIIKKDLSSREVEKLIARQKTLQENHQARKERPYHDTRIKEIQDRFTKILNVKTRITHLEPAGRITFYFSNLEELRKIKQALTP